MRVRRVSPSENLRQTPTTVNLRCLDAARDHALPAESIRGRHEDLGRLSCGHPSMRLSIVPDPDHLVVRDSEVDPSNWSRIGPSQLPKPLVRNKEAARNGYGEDSPREVAHWLAETTDARPANLGQPRLRREMDQHHHGEAASAQRLFEPKNRRWLFRIASSLSSPRGATTRGEQHAATTPPDFAITV